MIKREKFISDIRDKYSHMFTPEASDEYIYEIGRQAFPDINVEDWSVKPKELNVDTSPSGWDELIVKDINDDSWEWVKHAYANSLQGTLEQWKNGKLDYDIKTDYDQLNVGEKILSGVASFLMPLDMLTLFGGGLASRGVMAIGKKAVGQQLSKSLAGRGFLTKLDALGVQRGLGKGTAKHAIERAIVEGNTLGMYEAAKGGLYADNTGGDVSKAIADGYVHGSLMGALMGGTGGILEGNFLKYKALKELQESGGFRAVGEKGGFAKRYTIPELEKMMKYTGAIPQYAAEVAGLEAFTIAEAAKNGELKGEKLLEDLVVNIGFAGLMRGKRKLIGEIGNQYRKAKNLYEKDYHQKKLEELRKSAYDDKRPWQERLSEKAVEGLEKAKEDAKSTNDKNTEAVFDEAIDQYNKNREPRTFKQNEYLEELIQYDKIDKKLIYLEEALKENMDTKNANERVGILKSAHENILELLGGMDKLITDGHVTKVQGMDARAWLQNRAVEHKNLIDKYFHKTTETESKLTERQQTARTLFAKLQEKLASRAEKPSKEIQDLIVQEKQTFEDLIQSEKGVESYIRGTKQAISILEGKEGAQGRDITLKQSDYDASLSLLKDIVSGKDKTTAGSVIAKNILLGKDKSGKKYFEGVEDFSKVAFQNYTQSESSKQLKQYAPYVAKFLRATKNRSLDELTLVEVQSYIRDRVIERGGKPLVPGELSAISRFTKHISSGGGKFNKNIEWGINTQSIFKATNKRSGEGTNPSVAGVRKEALKIGKDLSSKRNDIGYNLVANLMAKFGIRDIEIPNITKDIIRATTVGGKKQYYIDMKSKEFTVDPSSGRELASIGAGKTNTSRAFVYIPKDLAESLISYLDKNSLKKKHYSEIGKNITLSNNKQRKQLDLRSRIETIALQSHPELLPQLKYILRHDKSRIDPIYQKMSPEAAIEMQIKLHKKLGLEGETPKVKQALSKEKINAWKYKRAQFEESLKEYEKLRDDQIKKSPNKKTTQMKAVEKKIETLKSNIEKINKKIGEEKPELPMPPQEPQRAVINKILETKEIHKRIKKRKDILEQYQPQNQREIINQKDMIVEALEGAQGAKTQAMISLNRFIRSHQKAIQDIKANPEKVFPEMFGKISWHESQISNYKQALNLLKTTPKEGRVEIGSFSGEGKGERRKLTGLIKTEQKYLGINRKQLGDKAYEREVRELTKNGLGYEDPVSSIKNLQTSELYTFLNLLRSTDYSKSGSKFKAAEASVKEIARERNVTPGQLKQMLLELGVKDGKFENVQSKEIFKRIKGIIADYERYKFPPSASDHIVTFLSGGFKKFPWAGRRMFTPMYALLKNPKIGGEIGGKIADKFLDYDVTHSILNGFSSRRLLEIRSLLGKNAHMLQFFDKEKRRAWKKDMTKEEIDFVKKMDRKGTDEHRAAEIWDQLRTDLFKKIKVYSQKWSNKAIDADINTYMNRLYIDDYFTRRVSKEFLEILPEIQTQPFYPKLFKKYMDSYVRSELNKMKKRENENEIDFKSRKEVKAESIRKDNSKNGAIDQVQKRIMNFLDAPNHKVVNKHLMERGILLPRKVEISVKGKRKTINTYDESFRGSAEYYGFSMGKYLSTLRHFPEVTALGKKLGLGNWKNNIFDILTSETESKKFAVNRDWADYLRLTLETHLGMESSTTSRINKRNLKWMGVLASTGAAAGLSTPLVHGIKNLGLGFINSNRHFGMRNTFHGFLKYMDIQERASMLEKGVGEYMSTNILRTQKNVFEEMGLDKKLPFGLGKWLTMDRIFDVNFMKKSEEVARISSAFAGGLYFHQLLGAYKGAKNSFFMGESRAKKKAEFAFKNQFKLSSEEINFLKNNKYEDLVNPSGENFKKMAWIQNKVEHFSHVSSQGGTSTILLPLWMSQPGWKPLTLFSRIATSATHDLWQNTFRPLWNHGNPMPLIKHSAASAFTGAGLYHFYKHIMGQEQMFEKDDARWKTLAQYLWRAEFLGLWTQLLNPHSSPIYGKKKTGSLGVDPTFVGDFFEPYMIRGARAVVEGATTLLTDPTNPKAYSQAIKHITKNTVSGIGQINKQWDRLIYPELHDWRGFRTAARSFKKEKGYELPGYVMQHARSIYYKDLKDTFWKGSEEDFAKSYYLALSYIDSEMIEDGFISPSFRRKEARKRLEQSLKTMNPVNFSDESKGRIMSKRNEFLRYLKNYDVNEYDRARKAEKEFRFKLRKLLSSVNKSKYKLALSPYYDRF